MILIEESFIFISMETKMIYNDEHMNNWKEEHLSYFANYISKLKKNSKKYNLIKEGLRELEKHI